MKIVALIAGAATLALAAAALAQTSAPSDGEAVGRWFSEKVKRPTNWPVVVYSPEAVVMARPMRDAMHDDMATGEVQIERTTPVDLAGTMWRSATVTSTVSCGKSLTPGAKAGAFAVAGQAHEMKMTLYGGQNLTGASRTVTFADGPLPAGLVGAALRGVCDRAIADAMDKGIGATAVLVGRDEASLDAWAKTLDFSDWKLASVGETTVVAYRVDSRRGNLVQISQRTEMSEPKMDTTRKDVMALTQVPPLRSSLPKITVQGIAVDTNWVPRRPVWIRSELMVMEFDCKKSRGQRLKTSTFDQHSLKGLLDEEFSSGIDSKVAEKGLDREAFRWACPA